MNSRVRELMSGVITIAIITTVLNLGRIATTRPSDKSPSQAQPSVRVLAERGREIRRSARFDRAVFTKDQLSVDPSAGMTSVLDLALKLDVDALSKVALHLDEPAETAQPGAWADLAIPRPFDAAGIHATLPDSSRDLPSVFARVRPVSLD